MDKTQDLPFGYPRRDLAQGQTIPSPARGDPEQRVEPDQTVDSGPLEAPQPPLVEKDELGYLQAQYNALQGRVLALTDELNSTIRTTAAHERDLAQLHVMRTIPTRSMSPTKAEIVRARLMDLTNPAFLVVVVAAIISFVATLPQHGLSPNVAGIIGGAFGVVYVAVKFLASMQGQSNVDKVLRATRSGYQRDDE